MGAVYSTAGPSQDTLRLLIHPYRDHVTWSLMRIGHNGPTTRQARIASGSVPIGDLDVQPSTARSMLALVLASLPLPLQAPASPLGDHRGEPTLDLDFSA